MKEFIVVSDILGATQEKIIAKDVLEAITICDTPFENIISVLLMRVVSTTEAVSNYRDNPA